MARQQQEMARQQQRPMPQMPGPIPQERQYQEQSVRQLLVAVELVHGSVIQINVPIDKFEAFVAEMNNAIDGQSAIPVGNKIVNGAQVVMYYVVEN